MQIFIQAFPGKVISLVVDPKDTVANLKASLADKEGIARDKQRLLFGGQVLRDDDTLEACHITKEETIQLVLRGPVETTLRIAMLDEPKQQLEVEVVDSDTVEDVKTKIMERTGYAVRRQRLLCRNKELENHFQLSHYSVQYETQVFLAVAVDPKPPMSRWKKCLCSCWKCLCCCFYKK